MFKKIIRIANIAIITLVIAASQCSMAMETAAEECPPKRYLDFNPEIINLFEDQMDFMTIVSYSVTCKEIQKRIIPRDPKYYPIYIRKYIADMVTTDENTEIMRLLITGAKYLKPKLINPAFKFMQSPTKENLLKLEIGVEKAAKLRVINIDNFLKFPQNSFNLWSLLTSNFLPGDFFDYVDNFVESKINYLDGLTLESIVVASPICLIPLPNSKIFPILKKLPIPQLTTLMEFLPKQYLNECQFERVLESCLTMPPISIKKICALIEQEGPKNNLPPLISTLFENIACLSPEQQIPGIDIFLNFWDKNVSCNFGKEANLPAEKLEAIRDITQTWDIDMKWTSYGSVLYQLLKVCSSLAPDQIRASNKFLTSKYIYGADQYLFNLSLEEIKFFSSMEINSWFVSSLIEKYLDLTDDQKKIILLTESYFRSLKFFSYQNNVLDMMKETPITVCTDFFRISCKFLALMESRQTENQHFGYGPSCLIERLNNIKKHNGDQLTEWADAFLIHADTLFSKQTDPAQISNIFAAYCYFYSPEELIYEAVGVWNIYKEQGLMKTIPYIRTPLTIAATAATGVLVISGLVRWYLS